MPITSAQRQWLLASLAAGASYYLVRTAPMPEWLSIPWKAAGVSLLALYALTGGRERCAVQIAAIMGFGALGDGLIEISLEAGAAAFLAGHLVAINLYWRNRAGAPDTSRIVAGVAFAVLTPLGAFVLTKSPAVALYAAGLGAMAGAAWLSRFDRRRVGFGAILFVLSDLLIFTRIGPMASSPIPDLLIWPLYYAGQLLICTGVVATLSRKDQASG